MAEKRQGRYLSDSTWMELVGRIYREIEDLALSKGDEPWSYESYVPGPLDECEVMELERFAWVHVASANPVRVYENEFHPNWERRSVKK